MKTENCDCMTCKTRLLFEMVNKANPDMPKNQTMNFLFNAVSLAAGMLGVDKSVALEVFYRQYLEGEKIRMETESPQAERPGAHLH